MHLVDWFM